MRKRRSNFRIGDFDPSGHLGKGDGLILSLYLRSTRLSVFALFVVVVSAIGLSIASTASASTITLSGVSSDATPASTLNATLEFNVLGGATLELIATNLTTAPDLFNISELFWNASSNVDGLTLTAATHSVINDVFDDWDSVATGMGADGFGNFGFSLMDGVGEGNPSLIGPQESITFLMTILGTCAGTLSCTMADFIVANGSGYIGAAKFVNGPDDPEAPGFEDSAFGATVVPEPTSALLIGLGLAALSGRRRR